MRIPEVRQRLHTLAREHGLPELHTLAQELIRRVPVRRAPPRIHCTEETKEAIRDYAEAHPTASYQEIAELFRVNSGRVSEALAGFRS